MDPGEESLPRKRPSRFSKKAAIGIAVSVLVAGILAGLAGFRKSSGAVSGPQPKRGCVVELDQDHYHCARLRDGSVHCWGEYVPTFERFQERPRRVTAFTQPAVSLFLERASICIGTQDGSLWCLNSKYSRQLRFPTTGTTPEEPVKQSFQSVRMLTWRGHCALTSNALLCWEPGGTDAAPVTTLPAAVRTLTGGSGFSCALLDNGQVWCRGANTRGQLGILERETERDRALNRLRGKADYTRLESLGSTVRTIASGNRHTCAIKADGSVWCWGENERGQIGKGDVSTQCDFTGDQWVCAPEEGLTPQRVRGLPHGMNSLALGETTSCATDSEGSAWCWGSLPEPTPTAQKLNLPEPVVEMSLGAEKCALFRSGAVRCGKFTKLTDWSDAVELDFGCP